MPIRLPLPGLQEAADHQRLHDLRPGQSALETETGIRGRLYPIRNRVNDRLVELGRQQRDCNSGDAEFQLPLFTQPNQVPRVRRLKWTSSTITGTDLMRLGARSRPLPPPHVVGPIVRVLGPPVGRHRTLSRVRLRDRVIQRLRKTFISQDLYQHPLKCIKSLHQTGL
eukprot:TRINITY_DN2790_c0_g1_i2.p1 TRINITY_DN2790_c0_g1~~TRINITY_DN2790_c0_g1_i2.p1  ORF type:complete len:168 (-),score=0.94 TRINITY_DN2790_c0_g1_i2:190-693(-)